jgi:hypothetical protein
MIGEFLRRVAYALDHSGIPWMLTGSVASSMYGVPRSTNDLDLVIAPTRDQLSVLLQFLTRLKLVFHEEEAVSALKNGTMFSVVDFANGWKVGFIVRKDRTFSATEFARRATHEVDGLRLTVATPEVVIISKLEWARLGESARQIDDAAGVLRMQRSTLDTAYIEQWVKALGLAGEWAAAQERAR